MANVVAPNSMCRLGRASLSSSVDAKGKSQSHSSSSSISCISKKRALPLLCLALTVLLSPAASDTAPSLRFLANRAERAEDVEGGEVGLDGVGPRFLAELGANATDEAFDPAICAQANMTEICRESIKNALDIHGHCQEPPCLTDKQALQCCTENIKTVVEEMPLIEKVGIAVGIVLVMCCLCSCAACLCRTCCCPRK